MTRPRASSPEISQRMKQLKRSGTRIEREIGRQLWAGGVRYRKNVSGLPGRPDFANQSHRWAVFVNGCFWHHHTGCRRATIPKSNREFWINKFQSNRSRDAKAVCALRQKGYCVILIWECERSRAVRKLSKIFETSRVNRR